jgi:hypothetical protein
MQKVFGFDKRIRYCAILDEMGRVAGGGMRPGVQSLEPREEEERVDIQMVVARGMSDAAHPYLGKTDYVIVHRDRLMLIAFPRRGGKTLLVSAEPNFPLGRVGALAKVVDENCPK